MAGDKSLESGNAFGIGSSNTAEESGVDIGAVRAVTVSRSDNAGVDTGGVAVPEVEVDVWNRLAGVDINDLDVDGHGHTLLRLGNVLTDEFTRDVVGSLSDFRDEDTAAVAFEEGRFGHVHVDAAVVGQVGSVKDGVNIAGVETLGCLTFL